MHEAERRRRRSESIGLALAYQLEHVQVEESLRAFILADRLGLLVASGPTALDAEELSALCPLVAAGHVPEAAIAGTPAALWPVEVDGETLFLLSIGWSRSSTSRSVARAAPGVQRILGRV
jgi:hypothetical protein